MGEEDEEDELYRSVDPIWLEEIEQANIIKKDFLNFHYENRRDAII